MPIALEQHAIRRLRTRRGSKAIDDDLFTYSLAALVGLSGRAVRDRMHADRESVIYYSGHFAHNPRSAVSLELLLADYFGVSVQIEQFVGQWLKLELGKVKQSYVTQILNMTGAYRREIDRSKGYHGRQLLELLQNADDEAENTKNPSVLIKLEQYRLIIANNGSGNFIVFHLDA